MSTLIWKLNLLGDNPSPSPPSQFVISVIRWVTCGVLSRCSALISSEGEVMRGEAVILVNTFCPKMKNLMNLIVC